MGKAVLKHAGSGFSGLAQTFGDITAHVPKAFDDEEEEEEAEDKKEGDAEGEDDNDDDATGESPSQKQRKGGTHGEKQYEEKQFLVPGWLHR